MTWANYSNTGPFTNNAAPGISATFLNNVESFLDQVIASAAGDSHLTADGNGLVTLSGTSGVKVSSVRDTNNNTALDLSAGSGLVKLPHGAQLTGGVITLLAGTISRISVFTGSANSSGTLQAHGLGVKPDFCMFQETSTGADTNNFTWDINASDATNVKVWSGNASSRSYVALAIKV